MINAKDRGLDWPRLNSKGIKMTNPVHIQIGNSHLMMPIHKHKDYPNIPPMVPFRNLSNDHAYKIHSRSLVTIRQRGGMSVPELYWNLTQSQAHDITDTEKAAAEIIRILNGEK